MAQQLSRHLLFPTEASQPPVSAEDDIFPREVRPPVMRLLWLGLFGVLILLTTIIVLVWGICGI